jgi:hypothetical protein
MTAIAPKASHSQVTWVWNWFSIAACAKYARMPMMEPSNTT